MTHGNYKIKKDLAKMNDPDYDSELSDSDQQFFTSSGRFNINQIKSSLNRYQSSQPIKNEYRRYPEYSSIEMKHNVTASLESSQNMQKNNDTSSGIESAELTPKIMQNAKEAMTKTSLAKLLDSYSDSMVGENSKKFMHTDNLQKLKSSQKGEFVDEPRREQPKESPGGGRCEIIF